MGGAQATRLCPHAVVVPPRFQAYTDASRAVFAVFDDTKLTAVWGSLRYQLAKQWTAAAGLGYEDYTIDDSQTGNTLNYMPASFFLQADNGDYQAWVGYVQLSYRWQ